MNADQVRDFDIIVGGAGAAHRLTGQAGQLGDSHASENVVIATLGSDGFQRVPVSHDMAIDGGGVVRNNSDLDSYLTAWRNSDEAREVMVAGRALDPAEKAASGVAFAGNTDSRELYYGKFFLDDYTVSAAHNGLVLTSLSMSLASGLAFGMGCQWWAQGSALATAVTPDAYPAGDADLALLVYEHRPGAFLFTNDGGLLLDAGAGAKTIRATIPGFRAVAAPARAPQMRQADRSNNGQMAGAGDYHWGWIAWLNYI